MIKIPCDLGNEQYRAFEKMKRKAYKFLISKGYTPIQAYRKVAVYLQERVIYDPREDVLIIATKINLLENVLK